MSEALETTLPAILAEAAFSPTGANLKTLLEAYTRLHHEKEQFEARVRKGEERRRAMIHIMDDMNQLNKKLADQRKAMLHILADYEQDRRRQVQQTERLDNSRRALLHILQDIHHSNGIIQEHHGTIWVENQPGEGATFFVELPLATPDAGTDEGYP